MGRHNGERPTRQPSSGSHEAIAMGCTCQWLDREEIKGWVVKGCPVHAAPVKGWPPLLDTVCPACGFDNPMDEQRLATIAQDWTCRNCGSPLRPVLGADLPPEVRARALLEAKIQVLTDEVVATSAIEGITIDPKEARKAVLRQLARQAGL